MKKILALHPSSELYGSDRIFGKVITFLADDNYSLKVVLKNDGDLLAHIQESCDVDITINSNLPVAVRSSFGFCTLLKFLLEVFAFWGFLLNERRQSSILYVNTLSLFICCLLGKLSGYKKIVVHSHEMIAHHGLLARLMISVAELFSDRIICVSEAVKRDMQNASFFSYSRKYTVVHNGVDIACDISKGDKANSNKIEFLLLGRIMPEKGQWYTLDAISQLSKDALKKIHVTFVGSPPPCRKHLLVQLAERIETLNLQDYVTVVDFVKDPTSMLIASDVCLVPSVMPDPFPTTVLEAMACGKPVISTNHGGAAEIIENFASGILINPHDAEGFKDAILHFIETASDAKSFGERGRAIFLNHLHLSHFKSRLISCFNNTVI